MIAFSSAMKLSLSILLSVMIIFSQAYYRAPLSKLVAKFKASHVFVNRISSSLFGTGQGSSSIKNDLFSATTSRERQTPNDILPAPFNFIIDANYAHRSIIFELTLPKEIGFEIVQGKGFLAVGNVIALS
jgi:hypothetical protein